MNQAELFAEALQARGVDVTLALFDTGHSISPRQREPAFDAFLERVLAR